MAWAWDNTPPGSGGKVTPEFVAELVGAIEQLATDVYADPVNQGDGCVTQILAGSGVTLDPSGGTGVVTINASVPPSVKSGSGTSNGSTGTTITFGTTMGSTDYAVAISWTAQPGADVGQFWVVKSAGSFVLKTEGPDACTFDWVATPYANA